MTTLVDDVLFNFENNKVLITLNRPQVLNALNLSMIRKIYPMLINWQKENKLDLIIIRGSGEKAFCAGGDIKAVADSGKGDKIIQKSFFKEEYLLNYAIGTSKIPWISFIDGITMGGGVGLSVHGIYCIATERSLFAMPETAIGLFPDVGGGYFLPRLRHNLGNYFALTGFRLKGSDVLHAGIATHFIDSDQIQNLADDLINLKSPASIQQINEIIVLHQNKNTKFNNSFILTEHLKDINQIFGANSMEEIIKNLQNLNTDWSKKQLEILSKMSPTSMKITLEQLKRGFSLDLKEVLKMEYRIGQWIINGDDFYEGVRAVLIDKDQKPLWKPSKLEEISDEQILQHFKPLKDDEELQLPRPN